MDPDKKNVKWPDIDAYVEFGADPTKNQDLVNVNVVP